MIDAFEIGISMTLADGVSAGLHALMNAMHGLNGEIERGQRGLNAMKTAAVGLGAAIAGAGILSELQKITAEAAKLENAKLNLRLAGVSESDVSALTTQAWQISLKNRDSTATDVLHTAAEMRSQFQKTGDLQAALPTIQDFITANKQFGHGDADGMARDAIKAVELRGRLWKADGTIDVASLKRELDAQHQMMVFTGGKIGAHEFRQMAAQAGTAATHGMSADAFYREGGEFANSGVSAERTGTILSSLNQQFRGGQMTAEKLENLISAGIIDGRLVEWNQKHTHGKFDPTRALENGGYQLLSSDPFAFMRYVLEHSAKALHTSADLVDYETFGRATTQRGAADAQANWAALKNASDNSKKVQGSAASADAIRADSYDNVKIQMLAQWQNLQTAFGSPGVPVMLSMMHRVTDTLVSMTSWALAHPDAVTAIMKYSAIGGATLLIAGVITAIVAGATMLAPVLLPLVGVGAALYAVKAAMGPGGTQQIVGWFNGLGTGLQAAWGRTKPLLDRAGVLIRQSEPYIELVGTVIIQLSQAAVKFGTDIASFVASATAGSTGISNAFSGIISGILSFLHALGNMSDAVLGTHISDAWVKADIAHGHLLHSNAQRDGESAGDFYARRQRDRLDVNGDPMPANAVPPPRAAANVPGWGANNPVYTHVVNSGDVGRAVITGVSRSVNRAPVGSAGFNGAAGVSYPGSTGGS